MNPPLVEHYPIEEDEFPLGEFDDFDFNTVEDDVFDTTENSGIWDGSNDATPGGGVTQNITGAQITDAVLSIAPVDQTTIAVSAKTILFNNNTTGASSITYGGSGSVAISTDATYNVYLQIIFTLDVSAAPTGLSSVSMVCTTSAMPSDANPTQAYAYIYLGSVTRSSGSIIQIHCAPPRNNIAYNWWTGAGATALRVDMDLTSP